MQQVYWVENLGLVFLYSLSRMYGSGWLIGWRGIIEFARIGGNTAWNARKNGTFVSRAGAPASIFYCCRTPCCPGWFSMESACSRFYSREKVPLRKIIDNRIPLRTVARVSPMALLAQRIFFVGVPVVELVGQASSDPDWLVRSGDWGRW